MELSQLRALAALADTGSLRRVGEHLRLSPAAVHRQLKLLSEEWGVQLYEGTRRQVRLTPAGAALHPLVKTLLLQAESVAAAAGEWRELKRGTVRIGTGPTFGTYVLPELLHSFRDRHPDVEVFVLAGHMDQVLEQMRKGQLDVAFMMPPAPLPDDLCAHADWQFRLVLVRSPRLALPRECAFADLRDVPFLLYQRGTHFEAMLDAYFARHGFTPRVTMRFDNAETVKAMVRQGFGVALLPAWTVQDELKRRTLRLVRQREEPLQARLALLGRRAAFLPPPVGAFLQMVTARKQFGTALA